MSVTASQLIAVVNVVGAAEAQAKLIGVGAASDETAARMRNALAGGALIAGAALVAIGAKSVEMAGNFEQATNTLVTSAGLSRDSIGAVRQGILDLSVSTATSTDQLVKGMFNVQSALHLGASGLEVLKAAAQGAKAENSDLAQTTDVLTTAMVNYHLSASQAVSTMNSLIVTVANGKMHMDDLTGSLKNVLPVSAAFHIKLSDVEGALATMANAGDRGTSAGTHLAMMFKMLSSPTSGAASEMKAMGISSIKLAETMRTSLPDALKMIQDAVSRHFTPGSVEYNRAIMAILGGSKSGIAGLELFGQGLKALGINTDDAAAALRKGGKDVENWDVIQSNFNFKLGKAKEVIETLMIRLGTGLLPIVGRMADGLASVATYVGDFNEHAGVLVPILAGIAAVLLSALVPAVWALAAGVIAATWPFLAIGVAVAGLVAIFQHFYTTNAGFKSFIDGIVASLGVAASFIAANFAPTVSRIGSILREQVLPALQQAASFIATTVVTAFSTLYAKALAVWSVLQQGWAITQQVAAALARIGVAIYSTVLPYITGLAAILRGQFLPVWAQLMVTWHAIQPLLTQLAGVFRMLWATIQQLATLFLAVLMPTLRSTAAALSALWSVIGPALLPGLKMLGIVIGGVLLVSLGLLVGVLIGVTGALARFLSGAIQVVQGVIQVFTGLAEFFTGIVSFVVDLFTGKWGKLAGDLAMIWQGIRNVASGAMTAMIGIFNASFGVILGFVSGFASGVIHFFTTLYNQLVGHSIVPDLCNAIINWFAQLPGRALGAVRSLAGQLVGFFSGLASQAVSWGRNVVQGVVNGINSMLGSVRSAASNVASTIANFLPHSPAKEGPLSKLNEFGPALVKGFSQGIIDSTPMLKAAVTHMVQPAAFGTSPPHYAFPQALAASSAGTPVIHVHNDNRVYLDGHEMAGVLAPQVVNHLRRKTGMRV